MAGTAKRDGLERWAILFAVECLIIPLAYLAALRTAYGQTAFADNATKHLPHMLILLACWIGAAADQYARSRHRTCIAASPLRSDARTAALTFVVATFLMAALTPGGIGRAFLTTFCAGSVLTLLVWRTIARRAFLAAEDAGEAQVLLVGANRRTHALLDALRQHKRCRILGILDDDRERAKELVAHGVAYLGRCADFRQVCREHDVDEVYVTLPLGSFYDAVQEIVRVCEGRHIPVNVEADLFQRRCARNLSMYVTEIPLLSLSAVPEDQARLALKRAVDFTVSSILLALLSPAFLALAILIKLDSKGPVFFRQERVGRNQRRFKMIKFRSMVSNAEALRKELEAQNEADGPVFKIRKDPRITRLGAFIRKYSIDEFPQLINVWKGEMSLVGPRPPIPAEVAKYDWDQRRRLSVRPGMTGLWQVSGRSDVNFKEWVELDLQYIDSWSLWQDFLILFKTFGAVVVGRGAA